jgi:membrane protein DedA with SNARE-associated domain
MQAWKMQDTLMTVQDFIQTFGYAAVFAGTFLEGETILLLGGFAAYQGYLSFAGVWAVATAGGFLGDLVFFLLGRWQGPRIFERFPRLRPRAEKVNALLLRYHGPVIIVLRFLYGLRLSGVMVIGASPLPAARFVGYNLIGALLWATVIGGAGYLFGNVMELLLKDIRRYEELVTLAVILGGAVFWLIRRIRKK